jgi:hypothetical protein
LSALSCPLEIGDDDFVAEASLRYLLSSLSVNFSLVWDPCIKVIDSYWTALHAERAWSIFHDLFADVNAKAADESADDAARAGIDFRNFRNLLLKSLDSMPDFVEKKNAVLAPMFLDVFMKGKLETKDPKGLSAFLSVYKQVKTDSDKKRLLVLIVINITR